MVGTGLGSRVMVLVSVVWHTGFVPPMDSVTLREPLPLGPQFTVTEDVFEDEVKVPPVMLHW